jgi:hypothetical protein
MNQNQQEKKLNKIIVQHYFKLNIRDDRCD